MKWGLRWELCIIIVFILCLLIATIGLNRFGLLSSQGNDYVRYIGGDRNDYIYSELEDNISSAGLKYYRTYYPNGLSKNLNVSVELLYESGYLEPLYDKAGRRCTGYAQLTTKGSSFGYLKCLRYRTEGYDITNE